MAASSPNVLAVTLRHASVSLNNVDPDSCVEMLGDLRFRDGRTMMVEVVGCSEFRNLLGLSYGRYLSGAFHYAAASLLRLIDEKYKGANEPLVFEADKIKIPAFPDVGVRTLALTISDDYSEDGSLGRNLAEELKVALAKAGVAVDENANQAMKVAVSHPAEDYAGRSSAICIVFEAKARLERGTAVGVATSCRGLQEAGHHQVLSQTLLSLWTEYARLFNK